VVSSGKILQSLAAALLFAPSPPLGKNPIVIPPPYWYQYEEAVKLSTPPDETLVRNAPLQA
jgi:hypothetical protein